MLEKSNSVLAQSELIYEGSVKNIFRAQDQNILYFEFSDRYSVFDWGEMPDLISQKGESLALFSYYAFEYLKSVCPNHCLGIIPGEPKILKVRQVQVHSPLKKISDKGVFYDYSSYSSKMKSFLIPLEVIFRFGVPEGGSLVDRLTKLKQTSISKYNDYMDEIGLDDIPKYRKYWKKPVLEFTTKLEPTDRFLTYQEAQAIAVLSDNEFQKLKNMASELAKSLRDFLQGVGIQLWDGKFEFAMDENRNIMLVDAVTPDELRLTKNDVQLSKEVLRQFYKKSEWYEKATIAKKMAASSYDGWKEICRYELKCTPPRLPQDLKDDVSLMYQALTNTLSLKVTGKKQFPNCPDLDRIVEKLSQWSFE